MHEWIWQKKNSRFYIYNQIFTQKLISKEIVYKMPTLEWKITMSLSYYIAMKEKDRYTQSIAVLTSRKQNKWRYLRKFLI